MTYEKYKIEHYSIDNIINWIETNEVAIPEIQRPFVWKESQVRDLLNSLYHGYPIGYLITWQNPSIKLKDALHSEGKRILIDGQQRVVAFRASLLGEEVMDKKYKKYHINISFNPIDERFEVTSSAIEKDPKWITSIKNIFSSNADIFDIKDEYIGINKNQNSKLIGKRLNKLKTMTSNRVGVIELVKDITIEEVAKIFILVNSKGVRLSQADFAMTKIAVNEKYDGTIMQKAIDYFCRISSTPEYYKIIKKEDDDFSSSEFMSKMAWLKNYTNDLYVPNYTDMLRVAFTSKINRGKLQDLVALLSGRNFKTREYEEQIAEKSFTCLKEGILSFINETNFKRFIMIIRSIGFINKNIIGSQNAINFAYIIYLRACQDKIAPNTIERLVSRWFAMSMLTKRYSASPDTIFDQDIRQITAEGVNKHCEIVIKNLLPSTFWDGLLIQNMTTSSNNSTFFNIYRAAQIKMNDKCFLSRDISVRDTLMNKGDIHHIFPQDYMKKQNHDKSSYNQIANLVMCQSEINIKIGNSPPDKYFAEITSQCRGGDKKHGNISDEKMMCNNLRANCIPDKTLDGFSFSYEKFLVERRKLMAQKIKTWFESL